MTSAARPSRPSCSRRLRSLSSPSARCSPTSPGRGFEYLDTRFLTAPPSIDPEQAGAGPAILATLYLGIIVLVVTVPLGVGTAIYLEEYADKNRWYNRLLEVNIQNLAAVPSIVYGILGLAFLVRGLGLGRVVLAGGLILTLLVLPTVIIAAREAIRAVPDSIRQGAYALGATRWQVISRQVLPAAIPGIATGSILALSRGIGETAPLIMIGALTYVAFNPTLLGPFTALPIQIYQWTSLPQEEFRQARGDGDHRSARHVADTERLRDLAPQPLPAAMVSATPGPHRGVAAERPVPGTREVVFDIRDLTVSYDGEPAISGVTFEAYRNFVTAIIGPSGCGKSTFIRCLNRMNDLIPGAAVEGTILYHGRNSTAATSIRSRCAGGSAWSSRSRTRFRSRSTTTSPSARACSG